MRELPALLNAWVRKLVVQAHRRGQEQEEHERRPCHRIAQQTSPCLPWHQGVPRDICREQPEIDKRVTGEPEQGPCQEGVGPMLPSQRPRNEHAQHLSGESEGRNTPHHKGDQGHERRQRCALVWVLHSPDTRGPDQIEGDQPGPHHHQCEPNVEGPVGLQGWIERQHDRGRIPQEGDRRQDKSARHEPVRAPREPAARQRHRESPSHHERQEATDKKRGPDEGVHDPV